MSLILEALKKSEAKRRLGEAPDLETPFAAQRRRRSPLPLIVAAIVVAAGIGWWLLRTPVAPTRAVSTSAPAREKPPVSTPSAAPVKAPAANPPPIAPVTDSKTLAEVTAVSKWVPVGQGWLTPVGGNRKHAQPANAVTNPVDMLPAPTAAPKPLIVVTPAGPPNTTAVATPPAGVKKTEPVAEPVAVAGLKKPEPPAVAASGTGVKKIEPPPEVAPTAGVKKPEPAAPVASGSDPPAYYALPFSVRKDLPALKLSMHVYAPEPPQRFIILNDSRMVEGNAQDDLALREIRPDGAIFEFRGQRFFYPRDGL